jgi:hypothetical protein
MGITQAIWHESVRNFFQLARLSLKATLEVSSLILGIVNGLMLLKFYLRDKANLIVEPIHPEIYQWWFRLSDGQFQGNITRRYGFIAYIDISNSGLRQVQLSSWRLFIKSQLQKWGELKPINMPEPSVEIGNQMKFYPVLGQHTLHFKESTMVESGGSTAGMVYYLYECYGGEGWSPQISNKGEIQGEFRIQDVFKRKAKCKIYFREKPLEYARRFAPGIDTIDKSDFIPLSTDPPEPPA